MLTEKSLIANFHNKMKVRIDILAICTNLFSIRCQQTVAKKAKEDERSPTEGMTEEEIEGMVEDLRKERVVCIYIVCLL